MERFLAKYIIAGIVEMPKCMMYWADETRFGPAAQKSNSMRKYFYIKANRTPKADDNWDYDP
jgi:hypothetical protein